MEFYLKKAYSMQKRTRSRTKKLDGNMKEMLALAK